MDEAVKVEAETKLNTAKAPMHYNLYKADTSLERFF